jgi:hypothetical protein
MAKALWECDTKKRMGLLHEIPQDEGGKVDFAWSKPISSRSWGMLPRESSLICDPLSGSFPIRKLMAFSGSPGLTSEGNLRCRYCYRPDVIIDHLTLSLQSSTL